MKKIYMLFAALAFVGLVTAQNYDWNISSDDFNALGKFEETKTVAGLTMYASEGKALEVDANGKSLNDVNYTHRLKFGGTGTFDAETGAPLNRVLSFDVDGDATITIMCMSSSSGSDRELTVAAGTQENVIGTAIALGPELTASVIKYTGEANTIYIWSPSSGVNVYRITVVGDDGTGVSVKPVLNNANVVGVEYYNISGANMGASLDFLPSGVYIKVVKFDNGVVDTKKVVKN